MIAVDPRGRGGRYLKRVVGLPNEEVRLSEGRLLIDGVHLPEPYLGGLPPTLGLTEEAWTLEEGRYFVIGDNRAHSTDSREFGPVGLEEIVGRVLFRWWPPGRWGPMG